MENKRVAVDVTEKAKGATFEDCVIEGGMRNAGTDTKVARTGISILQKAPKEHPVIFWAAVMTIVGTLFAIITWLSEQNLNLSASASVIPYLWKGDIHEAQHTLYTPH